MKNLNALIAMAQVAQNANNPYATFCEYIKYCVFTNVSEKMTITEIKEALGREFGLLLPHNILLRCLQYVQEEQVISIKEHIIKRIGTFDVESFEREREAYRNTELAIIHALIEYGSKYNRDWTESYARELLIKVLDANNLAYDIFIHDKNSVSELSQNSISIDNVQEGSLEKNEVEIEDIEGNEDQCLFTDDFFVGKFIEKILIEDTIQKDYLRKVCEGLMLCVGAYQLPSADANAMFPRIDGTDFFFDTKLLLRFVGCAGKAAVEAVSELVNLIQNAGGKIYYYPQTVEEMDRAFDKAIQKLRDGLTPRDEEMRLYASSVKNSIAVVAAKKASYKNELIAANIFPKPHVTVDDKDRIQFGFDFKDLQQYMQSNLSWDSQVIENDAFAIWETHMRRMGNYEEYCGTSARLPVFVSSNSMLISILLKYRDNRSQLPMIHKWSQNRLPVITDVRLTCRLWSPASQGERIATLYLSANAVAAKRPTKKYLNCIRELATELSKEAPQYSGICLSEYFDDAVTEIILEHTRGEDGSLDISSFASSITELTEWKAKEQEEITNQVISERDGVSLELSNQTKTIIEGAIESSLKAIGWRRILLWFVINWPITVAVIFTGITAAISYFISNWHPMWGVAIPVILKIVEGCSASRFISKAIVKCFLPKIEYVFRRRITKNLRKSEMPYENKIVQKVKEQTKWWITCEKMLKN